MTACPPYSFAIALVFDSLILFLFSSYADGANIPFDLVTCGAICQFPILLSPLPFGEIRCNCSAITANLANAEQREIERYDNTAGSKIKRNVCAVRVGRKKKQNERIEKEGTTFSSCRIFA